MASTSSSNAVQPIAFDNAHQVDAQLASLEKRIEEHVQVVARGKDKAFAEQVRAILREVRPAWSIDHSRPAEYMRSSSKSVFVLEDRPGSSCKHRSRECFSQRQDMVRASRARESRYLSRNIIVTSMIANLNECFLHNSQLHSRSTLVYSEAQSKHKTLLSSSAVVTLSNAVSKQHSSLPK